MTLAEMLTATPEEIQDWLNQQLANAPPEIQAVVSDINYVEPGSIRPPTCNYYVTLGSYEGDRDTIEIAFEIAPGAQAPFELMLKLL